MEIILSEEIRALAADRAEATKALIKSALAAAKELHSLGDALIDAQRRAAADDDAAALDESAALRVAAARLQADKLLGKITTALENVEARKVELQQHLVQSNRAVWLEVMEFVRSKIAACFLATFARFNSPIVEYSAPGVLLRNYKGHIWQIAWQTESWKRAGEIVGVYPHSATELVELMKFAFAEIEALQSLATGTIPKLDYIFFRDDGGEQSMEALQAAEGTEEIRPAPKTKKAPVYTPEQTAARKTLGIYADMLPEGADVVRVSELFTEHNRNIEKALQIHLMESGKVQREGESEAAMMAGNVAMAPATREHMP
jgi:hypothetical protein